jgi:hypothetical protein
MEAIDNATDQPAVPKPKLRWCHPTPGRLLVALLAVEGALLLSERWFPKGWAVLIAIAAVAVTMVLMLLWFGVALLFHRRFQFSIRSLLVLTVAVAVPCSWLAVEMKCARRQRETLKHLVTKGADVYFDYEYDVNECYIPDAQPPSPAWMRNILGCDIFIKPVSVHLEFQHITDDDLELLEGLNLSNQLALEYTPVTDAGLAHLQGLKQLEILWLGNTKVTDAGLVYLEGWSHLHFLQLDDTAVTDAGLLHLEGLAQLQEVFLQNTEVTDAGLEHLKGLNKLQLLYLYNTKVSDAGVAKLQKALPNCKIVR